MKIGILLYPMVLNKYTIGEAIQHYCLRHNLDDVIFVGFKGTDANMCCKNFQYNFRRNEDMTVKPLKLCNRGLHFCWELDAVFDYYGLYDYYYDGYNSNPYNRYFIALPEGPVDCGAIKMCSNVLHILNEIPRDMAEFYHQELRNGKRFHEAMIRSGLFELVNDTINEFIANNKDGNDYVNITSYNEGGD